MLALCLLVANPILANLTTLDKPAGFQAHIYPTVANSPLLRYFFLVESQRSARVDSLSGVAGLLLSAWHPSAEYAWLVTFCPGGCETPSGLTAQQD
jgi:hypothetical protein